MDYDIRNPDESDYREQLMAESIAAQLHPDTFLLVIIGISTRWVIAMILREWYRRIAY